MAADTATATARNATAEAQTFVAVAGSDGTWRQKLPPTPASKTAYSFHLSSSSPAAETASIVDVLFGEVYICGGQSNMEFSMAAVANSSSERQIANEFPTMRFFSVGHRTASPTPLRDLQTVWEPWQVASNQSINKDYSPGHTLFSTFSAVCWLFGRELSTKLSPTGDVPVGLVSNNWGGTKVEVWTPATAYGACNRTGEDGPMYNAMVLPYTVGPMALSGFVFYQGEANTANATTAEQYACLFPQMITAWRQAFGLPTAYFGFVQLSTWCCLPPESLPQMREAQMAALALPNVGYATNADHGMGCNIHPAAKQYVGKRLAASALAIAHEQTNVPWRSPTYKSAGRGAVVAGAGARSASVASLVVSLNDVGAAGLHTIRPHNYHSVGYGPSATQQPTTVDCTAPFVVNATYNASMAQQCAFGSLHVSGHGWLNASVAVHDQGKSLLLTAQLPAPRPAAAEGAAARGAASVLGSSYGWGPIPMLSAYDVATSLPVLPWNRSV